MNKPLGLLEIDRILGGGAPSSGLSDFIVLGMPHLCNAGLSETWLLKECGHRHWHLLAQASRRAAPDFCDAAGDPVYPAFVSVSLRDACLETARENQELGLVSRIVRISRTRFMSTHELRVTGRAIGRVFMMSVLVKRLRAGINRSIVRVDVHGLPPIEPAAEWAHYVETINSLRSNQWDRYCGFNRAGVMLQKRLAIDPCPSQDFNGVGFLYFSSFQACVDRAEWAFFRSSDIPPVRSRDIIYRGNIDLGDRIGARVMQLRRTQHEFAHWHQLERGSDHAVIADSFTIRGKETP